MMNIWYNKKISSKSVELKQNVLAITLKGDRLNIPIEGQRLYG